MIRDFILTMKKHRFLFEELVKRDFKQKYKRTALGMLWSVLSPLMTFLVMKIVFTQFFGRNAPHYSTYLLAGTVTLAFFKEATKGGMNSLVFNRMILTKVNMPKYLFLLSKNISCLINFFLTLLVFFVFAAFDNITFTWKFITLIYPVLCLIVLNIGVGLILSALFLLFRDTSYFYDIFLTLLQYTSAIFYYVDRYPAQYQSLFLINPVYCVIKYIRTIVIDGAIPDMNLHLILLGYALVSLFIGCLVYKKNDTRFVYYM